MLNSNNGRAMNWPVLLLAWVVATVVIALLPRPPASLVVDVEVQEVGLAQLFLDRGAGFSEADSIVTSIAAGRSTLTFAIPPGSYRALRLDPTNAAGAVVVHSVRLKKSDETAVPLDVGKAKATNIERLERLGAAYRLVPVAGTKDTQLLFDASVDVPAKTNWTSAAFLALVAVLGLLVLYEIAAAKTLSSRGLIATLTLIAVALALCLAVGSGQRIEDHPDEFSHVLALRFYVDHGLVPPAVLDPRTVPSISVWGFSYLFEIDIVYPLTALLLKLSGHGPESLLPDVRLFNVGLLLVLALAALRSRALAVAFAVVLLSPQIWYIFSYYNADCLPFVAALLLAGMAADEEGDIARFLRGEAHQRWRLVAFVLIGTVLLCSKRNYLTIFPMVGVWLAVRHVGFALPGVVLAITGFGLVGVASFLGTPMIGPPIDGSTLPRFAGLAMIVAAAVLWLLRLRREKQWRVPFVRLVVLGALCIGAAAPRYAWDYWQDGAPGTKAAAMIDVAERLAGKGFRPSDLQSPDRYSSIAPIRNGVGLWPIITQWQWARTSASSAFGFYGYMIYPAPDWTKVLLGALSALFFALGMFALRRLLPGQWLSLNLVAIGGALLVAESSLIHSWVNAFNPQGRYLFPALMLLAMPLIAAHRQLPRTGFRAILLLSTVLSAYSFVFVALATFMAM